MPSISQQCLRKGHCVLSGATSSAIAISPVRRETLLKKKGHGHTVRFVQLPFESHGYAAKENILHMLWEQDQWLSKYVKNYGTPYVK